MLFGVRSKVFHLCNGTERGPTPSTMHNPIQEPTKEQPIYYINTAMRNDELDTDASFVDVKLNSTDDQQIWNRKSEKNDIDEKVVNILPIDYSEVATQKNIDDVELKSYKRRYWMLFVLSISIIYANILYTQHVVLANITACYYDVTMNSIQWTTLIYCIAFILFSFPVSLAIDRFGLRIITILAAFLNVLCSAIMCAALEPDGFSIVLVSVTAGSFAYPIVFPATARLVALWFPADEVTRAYTIGFHSNTVGLALGFVYAPFVISNDCSNKPLIREGKATMTYSLTGATLFILLLTIFTFQNSPKKPPSQAEVHKTNTEISFKTTIIRMIKNVNFLLMILSNGITFALYATLAALLNPLMISYFPGEETAIGILGAVMNLIAIPSSMVAGYVLDRFHKFKEISIAMCLFSLVSYALFTGLLETGTLWVQYITILLVGFFLTGYVPVSYEYGVEITYPLSETTCNSFLTNMGTIFAFIFMYSGTAVIENYGALQTNIFFIVLLVICFVATCFIKSELKRTTMNAETSNAVIS